ncbi:MAG: hypothetical protein ACE5F5_13635 [Acidimicrobiia bacterium]
MRYTKLSFLAGWVAVALLAVAGFAAFGNPDPSPDQIRTEAAAASIGHTAGAYAGVTFALLGRPAVDLNTSDESTTGVSLDLETLEAIASQRPAVEGDDPEATESTTPITSSALGWLSEVEVRALVSLYFQPEDVNRAVRIAWCTSRFDPNSVDRRTGGVGLFHHLPKYWEERAAKAGFPGADPTDPEANVAAAAWAVYEGGGWDVFACSG